MGNNNTIQAVRLTAAIVSFFILSTAQAQFSGRKSNDQLAQADTLMQRDDYAGAAAIYSKLIESSRMTKTEEFQLLYKRAYCYYNLDKFDQSLSDISRYITHTNDPQGKVLRAYVYQQTGRTSEQINDVNDLIAISPGNPDLIRWRASILMEAERYSDARADILQIISLESSAELLGFLGLTYYYDNDPDSAVINFDRAIAKDPAYVQSYVYGASVALEAESYPLALDYANQGLRIEPSNKALTFFKGVALVESDREVEGCRCLKKVFDQGYDEAAAYLKQYCYGGE